MEFPDLLFEVKERIAIITLNRPEKKNALNPALIQSLKNAFSLAETDEAVKIIILKAAGDVFSAGADLAYLQQLQQNSFEDNLQDSRQLMELYRQIYLHPKLIIAQVQGAAIAGGCGLATVCDFCYSVPEAIFGYTEVKIGFVPALVSIFLVRKISESHVKQLLLTGELIAAEDAQKIGLISKIISSGKIDHEVWAFAQKLAISTAGTSVKLTKKLIAAAPEMRLQEALDFAASLNAEARSGEDFKKGITAFLEKRKTPW